MLAVQVQVHIVGSLPQHTTVRGAECRCGVSQGQYQFVGDAVLDFFFVKCSMLMFTFFEV